MPQLTATFRLDTSRLSYSDEQRKSTAMKLKEVDAHNITSEIVPLEIFKIEMVPFLIAVSNAEMAMTPSQTPQATGCSFLCKLSRHIQNDVDSL